MALKHSRNERLIQAIMQLTADWETEMEVEMEALSWDIVCVVTLWTLMCFLLDMISCKVGFIT